jgi:hypothetical protein
MHLQQFRARLEAEERDAGAASAARGLSLLHVDLEKRCASKGAERRTSPAALTQADGAAVVGGGSGPASTTRQR